MFSKHQKFPNVIKLALPIIMAILLALASCRNTKAYWISPLTRKLDIKINYKTMKRNADSQYMISRSDSLYLSIVNCVEEASALRTDEAMKLYGKKGPLPFDMEPLDYIFKQPMVLLSIKNGPFRGKVVINRHGLLIHREDLFKMDSICFENLRSRMIEQFDRFD
jgi:hypothetical protein